MLPFDGRDEGADFEEVDVAGAVFEGERVLEGGVEGEGG